MFGLTSKISQEYEVSNLSLVPLTEFAETSLLILLYVSWIVELCLLQVHATIYSEDDYCFLVMVLVYLFVDIICLAINRRKWTLIIFYFGLLLKLSILWTQVKNINHSSLDIQ